jgi:hypothetical protein
MDELNKLPRPELSLPNGVSREKIEQFERQHDLSFSDELRDWLTETNAPYVGGQYFMGLDTDTLRDIEVAFSLVPQWQERGWIPVAGDGSGNYYLEVSRGDFGPGKPIIFLDHEIDLLTPSHIVASSFKVFAENLIHRELHKVRWPFDKEFVLANDPAILDFKGIALPWDS